MSRYLLLVILNLPLIVAGITNAIIAYKLRKSSKAKSIFRVTLWLVLLIAIASAYPIYSFLFSNNLTQTEPLSLFDVVQITFIVIVFYLASRTSTKLEALERRFNDLHQELSITLSERERHTGLQGSIDGRK